MKKLVFYMVMVWATAIWCREIDDNRVKDGIDAFYQAEFEKSGTLLRSALLSDSLSLGDRFDAHLYLAFTLIRENGHADSSRSHLEQAVALDPNRDLDSNLIPPDLYEQYLIVRQSSMGGLAIFTQPPNAVAILYDRRTGRSISIRTPAHFVNLVKGEYDLLLHLEKYADVQKVLTVQSGRTDSLSYDMPLQRKAWYKRWYTWSGGGAALLLAWFVLHRDDGGKEPALPEKDLPVPPKRP
jgi:hypothetical protein